MVRIICSMEMARLWHGARNDVGMVGNGMGLHDHLLGTHRPGFDLSHPMACWNDENDQG